MTGVAEPAAGPLVLVHIPRTAGTTLAMMLRYHYRGGAFTGGGNAFARFDRIDERLRKIATKARIRAVAGHLTFGLADRLPPTARYIALLRDPVERTLSHHYVLPRSRPQGGRGLVPPDLPRPPADLTLEEALAPGGYIPDNLQTRMLCGLVSPYDELPPDALERAMQNLRNRFAYVGTTERFDEFLALLNLELGWPTVAYRRSRAFAGRTEREELSAELLGLVEARNALDAELHAYAGELLAEALARAEPGLQLEVEVLRAATRRWSSDDDPLRPDEIRSIAHEGRVALALKEAELKRAATQARRLAKKQRRP